MSNPNIVLVHGNGGLTAEDLWFPEVKTELEAAGLEVVAETMPDNYMARSSEWLPFLHDVLNTDENSIIVGHSSGAAAAMRYAETHHIFGSVLVAASYTDLGIRTERMSGYFDGPWDWEAIKAHQNWIVQFAAANDPYIPIEEPRHIHKQLNTDYYEDAYSGHFEEIIFPKLVAVLKSKLT